MNIPYNKVMWLKHSETNYAPMSIWSQPSRVSYGHNPPACHMVTTLPHVIWSQPSRMSYGHNPPACHMVTTLPHVYQERLIL